VWSWLLAAVAASSWLVVAVVWRRPAGPAPGWLVADRACWAALTCLALAAVGAARLARSREGGRTAAASPALLLRLTAVAGLAALVATTAVAGLVAGASRELAEAAFAGTFSLGLAVCAAVLALRPPWLGVPRRRWARVLDAAAFNAVVVLVVAELCVVLAARLSSSPLLHFDRVFAGRAGEQAARENLRRFRLKPGTPFFDTHVNSRGYPDDEPFTVGPRDFAVAVLADSFGVGIVPHEYNFTTVAERALQRSLGSRFERIAVQNYGVASISPPEYYYLLLNEVMPTRPSLVVLCLFVGNDLGAPLARPALTPLALQSWRFFQLATRVVALGETRAGGAVEFTDWGRFEAGVPAWITDPGRERPSFSEERFMQIELERAGWFSLSWDELPSRYEAACRTLGEFQAVLGDRLLVAVLPDELQVNDALWQEVLRRVPAPAALRRDYPQQHLVPCCERARIQVLDLLPALRTAQRTAPTYHLRDTHWNAHGNRVAGEAIAAWILSAGVRPR
jgi:hypothetical protein